MDTASGTAWARYRPGRDVLAAAVLAAAFLTAYLPYLGHGFIQDDFRWIAESRSDSLHDILALFTANVGFYRPMVSSSFTVDHAIWGMNPFGYGLTNLTLCLIDALLLFSLARRFTLPVSAALLTSALWAFNFHGINMALLWLSGRTALLAVMFALAMAHALVRGWRVSAGLLCLAALLTKEEAVLLPAWFTAFVAFDRRSGWDLEKWRGAFVEAWYLWAALAIYLVMRHQSGAFGPSDAPSYYQFSFAPALVVRNFLEYLDRTSTVAGGVVLIIGLACGVPRSSFSEDERRLLVFAGLWIPAMCALTLFLPVRSSLYAVLPSIGTTLAAGLFASRAARARPARFHQVATGLVATVCLLIPVYWSRNQRWAGIAELSTAVLRTLDAHRGDMSQGRIVLVDDRTLRFNLDSAFGAHFPDALRLTFGNAWEGEIASDAPATSDARVFRLRDGDIVEANAAADRNDRGR